MSSKRLQWRSRAGLFVTVLGVIATVLGLTTGISAAVDPVPNYTSYNPIPAGCAANGDNILSGLTFSAGGQSSTSLRTLAVKGGDTLTMTWSGFAPGCATAGIGLSIKTSLQPTFVDQDLQYVVRNGVAYCGPEGPVCTAPFSLTLVIPSASAVPCWQLDAHIGRPLMIVGPPPAGDFYSFGRPVSFLISARNDGVLPCTHAPCPGLPAIPASAVACVAQVTTTTTMSTTTTTAPTTTTTAPPQPKPTTQPCSTNPAIPADSPDCKPAPKCAEGQVLNAQGVCVEVAVTTNKVLPVTGADSRLLLFLGGLLMLIGLPVVGMSRRRA